LAGEPTWRLVAKLGPLSPEEARDLVDFGSLWLQDRPQPDPAKPLETGQKFRLSWPRYGPNRFYQADPGRIVFQDETALVYNKESGRPAQSVPHDNYNNAQAALERLTGQVLRLPHRLDAGTSGLLLVARSSAAAGILGQAFSAGRVRKLYLALTQGPPPLWSEKTVRACVAKAGQHYVARATGPGKPAQTILRVIATQGGLVLWAAEPLTGRTHQIRLHLAFEGYPILGDTFYGGGPYPRLALRAAGLRFKLPSTKEILTLSPPEEELRSWWEDLVLGQSAQSQGQLLKDGGPAAGADAIGFHELNDQREG
jgi:23S rRNA pseudouridine1911/1915/1917 synthase